MYTKPLPMNRLLKDDVQTFFAGALEIPDLFGVEVELEGRKIKTNKAAISAYWTQHTDNSLRAKKEDDEATEYVLAGPKTYDDTMEAISRLFAHLNSPGVEVYKSYRTSIHVHLSCMLETHRTIFNFMTLAVIFDELLTSQNGRHRIGNNFCLRAKDANGLVEDVIWSVEKGSSFLGMDHNKRYSSVNFVSLLKYGTIEFRSLECTTDFNRVKHWIDTLARLKKMARAYENPQSIIREFSLMPAHEFMSTILGPQAGKYLDVKGWETMLQTGMRLAQDLAYCCNWVPMKDDEKYEMPKKKSKYADLYGQPQEPGEAGGQHVWMQFDGHNWVPQQQPEPPQALPLPNPDDPFEDEPHWNFDDED